MVGECLAKLVRLGVLILLDRQEQHALVVTHDFKLRMIVNRHRRGERSANQLHARAESYGRERQTGDHGVGAPARFRLDEKRCRSAGIDGSVERLGQRHIGQGEIGRGLAALQERQIA